MSFLMSSNIEGELDTQEELLSLYGPLNTGTTTDWFIIDIPVLGQVSIGRASNEIQTGWVLSMSVDTELLVAQEIASGGERLTIKM